MARRKWIVLLIVLFAYSILFLRKADAGEYCIAVNAVPTSDYTVDVDIDTNLPDGSLLGIVLSLEALKDREFAVSTSFTFAYVKGGRASASVDIIKDNLHRLDWYVSGRYEVTVSFYPPRLANRGLGVEEYVVGVSVVELEANGRDVTSLESLIFREQSRNWMMDNVTRGMKWEPEGWVECFGAYEQNHPSEENRESPEILQFFYFPQIDLTLAVDAAKKEIITFLDGRTDL